MIRYQRYFLVLVFSFLWGGNISADYPVPSKPFNTDSETVCLYHFDEGKGNETYDACGDPALTLKAKHAMWGKRVGFGSTASFKRCKDDVNIFIGPKNNDKLHLRTCKKEWTIEAWCRYTGPWGKDGGHTYANICGTDEEGFSLPRGIRGGWNFAVHSSYTENGLSLMARFIGSTARAPGNDVNAISPFYLPENETGVSPATIVDDNWHHVVWQFRYEDQTHYLFIDGKLIWLGQKPNGRQVVNDAKKICIPFHVGGMLSAVDPPFNPFHGDWEGEIDEIRISNVMRYPVSDRLKIVHSILSPATYGASYRAAPKADGSIGVVQWQLISGSLPTGLTIDKKGRIGGISKEGGNISKFKVRVIDAQGNSDEHEFILALEKGQIETQSLPLGFVGEVYKNQFQTRNMIEPIHWRIQAGKLPLGISLDSASGIISGRPKKVSLSKITIGAEDRIGQKQEKKFVLKIVPAALRKIQADKNTVVLYDWQGPDGKYIRDVTGDKDLVLTWANMPGDIRVPREGWGVYPYLIGGGERGFVGPQKNAKLDLRTCKKAWTVEAWVRPGGNLNKYGKPFSFGHICGTYDTTKRGVWELYLSRQDSPDGSLTPGVNFQVEKENQALLNLCPWQRPEGIVADREYVGIRDSQWHHIAWQYSYDENRHKLFVDGVLIWEMRDPDGRAIVNERIHDAQFSVGTRLNGFAKYGGKFNWQGDGNFFGQIGEIRISNICRDSEKE